MTEESESIENIIPVLLKRGIMIAGLVLAIIGLPPALNLLCIVPLSLLSSTSDTPVYALVSLILVAMTMTAGGVTFYHAIQSGRFVPNEIRSAKCFSR